MGSTATSISYPNITTRCVVVFHGTFAFPRSNPGTCCQESKRTHLVPIPHAAIQPPRQAADQRDQQNEHERKCNPEVCHDVLASLSLLVDFQRASIAVVAAMSKRNYRSISSVSLLTKARQPAKPCPLPVPAAATIPARLS